MGVSVSSPAQNKLRQSPINITIRKAKYDSSLKPLCVQYDPTTSRRLVNVGHCFNLEFDDSSDRSVLSEGPLTSFYRLRQFHFHWGSSDRDGSEHVIDGKTYPAELHIVHWNSEKYGSFEEATKNCDGLAVVAVLLKIGDANPAIQSLIDHLDEIKTRSKECSLAKFNATDLLPKDIIYWTYLGSLTTSPFLECVTWIVLQEAITVSSEQLQHFRELRCSSEAEKPEFVLENHRKLQPLEGRIIRSSCKNTGHRP